MHGERAVAPRLVLFVVSLGATFPLQQIALRSWPPILLVGVRAVAGGLMMMALTRFPRRRTPSRDRIDRPGRLVWLIAFPALCNVVFLAVGVIYAIRLLSGGEASFLAYTQPLFFAVLARWWWQEPLTRSRAMALALGFCGLALITLPFGTIHFEVVGILAGVGAGISWAVGAAYLRRYTLGSFGSPDETRHLLTVIGGPQFVLGGVVLLVWGSIGESWGSIRWTPEGILAAACFTLCGATGWLAYLSLIDTPTAVGRIASWSFGVPVVANLAGVFFLHEHLGPLLVVGGLSVVVSIILVESPLARAVPE